MVTTQSAVEHHLLEAPAMTTTIAQTLTPAFCLPTAPLRSANDYDLCTQNDMCVSETSSDGLFTRFRCRGTPVIGEPCNDGSPCTIGDVCVLSEYSDNAICRGTPTPNEPCDDNNPCTEGDYCLVSDSGLFAFCRAGTPTRGVPCDDGNDATTNDECTYDSFTVCRGEFVTDAAAPSK
jgi:hypothetical protein